MPPQTTLAPNAPWPTAAELAAAIAVSHEKLALTGQWQRTTLWATEINSLRNFIRHHTFQLKQLSRSELETALNRATAAIKSEGCTVEVVRDVQAFGQERMAA